MPKEVIVSLLCWKCEYVHEFKRCSGTQPKCTNYQKAYDNKLYFWISLTKCQAGQSDFTPGESLTLNKFGKERGYKGGRY